MNLIPQQGFLMEGTVGENIGQDDNLIREFLSEYNLKMKLDGDVQHDGCNLSSGER
jgi:hypothetical protein